MLELLVTELPSPKLHIQLVMLPVEASVNVTDCVTKMFVGVPLNPATGAATPVEGRVNVIVPFGFNVK
jgi:hypothetical protein